MKKRMIALVLAFALVFSLFGCQSQSSAEPTETQPVATEPPAPDPAEVYNQARAALEEMTDVTLDVKQVLTTTVEGHSFVDESEQILTYSGLGTDAPVIRMEEEVEFYGVVTGTEEDEEEDTTRIYSEIYADGTLYIDLEDEASLSGSLSAEESADRYIPAVLLDAALYEDLKLTEEADQSVISFAAPTAPENWVMPEEAQLVEASGSAVVAADGTLKQMNYAITYQYGPAKISLEVESVPRATAETVTVPEDTESYTPVQSVDALQMALYSSEMLKNAQVVSVNKTESIISQAGGLAYDQMSNIDMYDNGNGLKTKIEAGTHIADAVNGSYSTTLEETYQDGTYVVKVDNGVPTSQPGVKEEDVRKAFETRLSSNLAAPNFWQDVTIEDLGSVYLLEYTYTEDFGNSLQNTACLLFWGDATVLNKLATDYANKEITGYLAIDKYTGMMTASGTNYEGVHTIEGDEYSLIMQVDQQVQMPSFGAYKAITDKLLSEEEPTEKATPLFYHVTGAEGQEMWLLGTIHVGDVRTGFLPNEIYTAFAASDALALEMDEEAFEEQMQKESVAKKLSKAMYYRDGSTIEEHLDEELYTKALKYMKASGNYSENMLNLKPYLWQSAIENFYLEQGHQLHAEQGVEERLVELAKEQEKPIREIESGLKQIQMLTGWSEELQQVLLEDALSYSAEEYWTETYELYELWCAGDEEALRKELSSVEDLSELTEEELAEYNALLPLYEEFDKGMNYDRNEDMLDVAIKYLESGEVIFYAVGLAHLLNDVNGLVDALRAEGYTVEPVTYYL